MKSIQTHESIYNEQTLGYWAQLPIQDYTCEWSSLPVTATLRSPAQVRFIYQKNVLLLMLRWDDLKRFTRCALKKIWHLYTRAPEQQKDEC